MSPASATAEPLVDSPGWPVPACHRTWPLWACRATTSWRLDRKDAVDQSAAGRPRPSPATCQIGESAGSLAATTPRAAAVASRTPLTRPAIERNLLPLEMGVQRIRRRVCQFLLHDIAEGLIRQRAGDHPAVDEKRRGCGHTVFLSF